MDNYNPATRTITVARSPSGVAVDNLLRRSLKIADPNNADEVAKALMERYAEDADRIRREKEGLPFTAYTDRERARAATAGPMREEIAQAMNDLDRDLAVLTTDIQLKDIAPELRGWGSTIRRAASDGLNSARFGLDPRERDRAFATRRTLGEYARLARYLAATMGCATALFCRLAQSCDVVASLIIVGVGDALAEGGVTRSAAVLSVSAADLQSRRDSVIFSLRNLAQTAQSVVDQDTWPRGLHALSQVYRELDASGAGELRPILDESYLSRMLDDLVDLAAGSTPDGLRALSSAATMTVQRIYRFIAVTGNVASSPPSPPFHGFLESLKYFVDAFANNGAGSRLPFLARPPILSYGLYGAGGADDITRRLQSLAIRRNSIAELSDCLCCSCDGKSAEHLVLLGKVIFDIDRSIDLLALSPSTTQSGSPEVQAATYGLVALKASGKLPNAGGARPIEQLAQELLRLNAQELRWPDALPSPRREKDAATVRSVLCEQAANEERIGNLVERLSNRCNQSLIGPSNIVASVVGEARTEAGTVFSRLGLGATYFTDCPPDLPQMPFDRDSSLDYANFQR